MKKWRLLIIYGPFLMMTIYSGSVFINTLNRSAESWRIWLSLIGFLIMTGLLILFLAKWRKG